MITCSLVSGVLRNLGHTKVLACHLADLLNTGDTLLLKGPVGAGKTTLARFLIQHMMKQEIPVVSPTFTLMQLYSTLKGPLWHVDLYRLQGMEPFDLDLQDLWHSSITVVEWPERLGELHPPQSLLLEIRPDRRSHDRYVHLEGTPGWEKRLRSQKDWGMDH